MPWKPLAGVLTLLVVGKDFPQRCHLEVGRISRTAYMIARGPHSEPPRQRAHCRGKAGCWGDPSRGKKWS
jgi:hypothetical protein